MAGGIEHADGLYMMTSMPMDVEHRAITVEEVMRANFPHGWPNSDAVILQLDGSREGAAIDWTQLLAHSGKEATGKYDETRFGVKFRLKLLDFLGRGGSAECLWLRLSPGPSPCVLHCDMFRGTSCRSFHCLCETEKRLEEVR